MDIGATVCHILNTFKAIITSRGLDGHKSTYGDLANENDRFKIWAGNLAAHRTSGRCSLEYRLRDSRNLRLQVLDLLDDLRQALEALQHGESNVNLIADVEMDSGNDSENFEYDDLATTPTDPIQDVHDTIALLYRFSATLRNPSGYSRTQELSSDTHSEAPHDFRHVQKEFPQAEPYLVERLSNAISKRGHQLRHRRSQHSKSLPDIASHEHHETTTTPRASSRDSLQDVIMEEFHGSTLAYHDFTGATETQTSASEAPSSSMAVPLGAPVACPTCFTMQVFNDMNSWQTHIFEDITPYVCIFEDCHTSSTQYSCRERWQAHCVTTHMSIYACPLGCETTYASATVLETHLTTEHECDFEQSALRRISRGSAQRLQQNTVLLCPLCREPNDSDEIFFRHVGKHLEHLAYHTLPSSVLAKDPAHKLEELTASDTAMDDVRPAGINERVRELGATKILSPTHSSRQSQETSGYMDLMKLTTFAPAKDSEDAPGTKVLPHDKLYFPRSRDPRDDPEEMYHYQEYVENVRAHPDHTTISSIVVNNARERPTQPTYMCLFPKCWYIGRRKADFEEHVMRTHSQDVAVLLDCEYSGCRQRGLYGFTTEQKLQEHMRAVHGIGHSLTALETRSSPDLSFDSGLNALEPSTIYQSNHDPQSRMSMFEMFERDSGYGSSTRSSNSSRNREFDDNDDDDQKLQCHWCKARFTTQSDLTHHLRSHAPYMSRQHVCPHCEKRFQYRKDLARHMPKHDPNRTRYYCPVESCKYHMKGFGRQDHLERHVGHSHRGVIAGERDAQVSTQPGPAGVIEEEDLFMDDEEM